jgi:hypothetical protein
MNPDSPSPARLATPLRGIYGLLGLALLAPPAFAEELPETVDFNRDIRPILSDNCFYCHGNDPDHRKAKLRLDIREEALAKEAFVPGKPEESLLVERILTDDEDDLMPPPDSHKKLTQRQKDLLAKWIEQGAEYRLHWSYEAPAKAEIPEGAQPVDHLVRKRLQSVGLKPSPEADRRTLARRLHADLVGLPPRPEEVAAFLADESPDAYARLVDRLLASPHYGERMAIGWLDVVRFADTIGYHSDNPRNVWPYRDWVIASFNANKPFDRFTIEQLAGDLLPDASLETRVGSAFNRLLLSTEEGGAQAKDYEQRMLTDRVRAVGAAWMGQTTGCAQCHDHKFDPFSMRDFYSLGAFFADIKEPILGRREEGIMVLDEAAQTELDSLAAKVAALKADFSRPRPELAAGQAAWEAVALEALAKEASWQPVAPVKASSAQRNITLAADPDGTVRATIDATRKARNQSDGTEVYTLSAKVPAKGITGIRLTAVKDKSPGIGLASNGNFVLNEIIVSGSKSGPLALAAASATFEQAGFPAAAAIDGEDSKKANGWAVLGGTGTDQALHLALAEPFDGEAEELSVMLAFAYGENHAISNLRLGYTTAADPAGAVGAALPDPEIAAILQTDPAQRQPQQSAKLDESYRQIAPELEPLRAELATAEKAKADYEAAAPKCIVSVSDSNQRVVRILPRGNWMDESGEIVKAALPHYLPGPDFGERVPDRLDLGKWLVARDNPLTARTVMNRMWKHFFGSGLSKVLDDLGAQGEPPVNPELLDWLACEFMDSGWDWRHMVRTIVLSETYRQSSVASPELAAADPENRECARQSPFRHDAELIRDHALAVSGLLVAKIGGPSAKPYQPEGYWENLNFPVRTYAADTGESQYRRGLYTWWQRSFLHPSMVAFDAPSREECAAERNRSNIPQQALVLLNDPTYVEAARAFAARILTECQGDAAARVRWAWQAALQREPDEEEARLLAGLVARHLAEYEADPEAAGELLKVGLAPLPEKLNQAELAAWTHAARVLLNLHESVTRS